MLHHPTVERLHELRLFGMAAALADQQSQSSIDQIGFEERLGLLVEREASERQSRLLSARLRRAKLRFPDAVPEDINYRVPRGLDRALVNQACRQGFSACYLRMPKFNEEMAIAHGSGGYAKLLSQWAKTDILVMDDLAMAPLSDPARRDLLEVLDDRHGRRSTIVTSQIPVDSWHAAIGDPTLADAILDRLVHNAHRLTLSGESMRKRRNGLTTEDEKE